MLVMPDQPPVRLVDSRRSAFVSFAPPDPTSLGPRGRTPARAPIQVGSERAPIAEPSRDDADVGAGVTYPIQAGKIQPPNLRDETLARTRLLDWLDIKIHRRLVYVIADAGYGKTTLLADFSRRTRLRTVWYRLDEEDRDWVGFLAHLVAAGREHDPGFAPRTAAILRSLEPGGPSREDAVETFIAELPAIASDGAALILDDFHLADEVADIRLIAREIVARGPERLSVVFASRRPPSIPVSKLRSLGELAELGIADLRFSETEMEQLFRETFGRPLEPDVLSELARRTEGWAASLTLVQAALRERTPAETRSFVRGLSGARDELHDYLAEEVVGDLPAVQQQFLMRTSLLQRVTPELAQVATGLDANEVQSMIAEAERLGLLGRRAKRRSSEQRYHPLVREFLEDRLRRDIGAAGVDELHVTVARWAEPHDWQSAAHHYAQARDEHSVVRVIDTHLDTIVGTGAFATAFDYYRSMNSMLRSAGIEVIESRRASRDGDVERVLQHAAAAAEMDPGNETVTLNLIASHTLSGDLSTAERFARSLVTTAGTSHGRRLAEAAVMLFRMSVDGDLVSTAENFADLADASRRDGHGHYEGVSELNAANGLNAAGRFEDALARAQSAIDALTATSSGAELKSAIYAKAVATAYLGNLEEARTLLVEAGGGTTHSSRSEYLAEHADIEAQLGSSSVARDLLSRLDQMEPYSLRDVAKLSGALLSLREGDAASALKALETFDLTTPSAHAGMKSRVLATRALGSAIAGEAVAAALAEHAVTLAGRQHAGLWEALASLVAASQVGQLDATIRALPQRLRCTMSMSAELVVSRLGAIGPEARELVIGEARSRPDRWLPAIRALSRDASNPGSILAARLLAEVGTAEDVPLLSAIGKAKRATALDRFLGRDLARRLAQPVFVADLGRVSISVGPRSISGQDLRRKVLALLCYLLTRPRFAATREEVMEAMWPGMAPTAAVNSLNQSVYFLRRVFEPEYSDDSSAGYVRQDSDLLWLDTTLVRSASSRCIALLAEHERTGDSRTALELSEAYTERFALDFSYDEWAGDYRDWLHVSCLRVLEDQVRTFANDGAYDLGIAVARRALQTDPRNEALEASLLRLLRGYGAHAAAAEQYSRYSMLLRRDLGVEPPPPEDV